MSSKRKRAGVISIDSGQVMLVDPCYLRSWVADEYSMDDEKNDEPGTFSYSGVCRSSGQIDGAGAGYGKAVVTRTGYGDGVYDVFVTTNDEGRVEKLEAIFIGDDNPTEQFMESMTGG
tara:strand:- start:65 stop:418 length:354 start_codon:yes stop_codon:yes gene_type:complete